MKEERFVQIIKQLESAHPEFRSSGPMAEVRRMTYFRGLKDYPDAIVEKAMERAASELANFPSLYDLREICDELSEKVEPPIFGSNYELPEHTCAPTPPENEALATLQAFLPFEAKHICCQTRGICPECGDTIDSDNPWMVYLMQKYPDLTQGWNPKHKGYLLCAKCSR